ncbi:MAG: DUF397 domain-containing protein, partial [Gemmatimonadota bacterium]
VQSGRQAVPPALDQEQPKQHRGGNCIEVTHLPNGGRAVRDSKNPAGPALTLTPAVWAAFTTRVRSDEFDSK